MNKIIVRQIESHFGVFASQNINKSNIILQIKGMLVNVPSLYSIQIGTQSHLEPFADSENEWKFLNHSCEPNALFNPDKLIIIALRDIKAGEEICFNYHTTEYEISSPFLCKCSSKKCYGRIKGFNYLSEEEQKLLLPYTATHIQLLYRKKDKKNRLRQ